MHGSSFLAGLAVAAGVALAGGCGSGTGTRDGTGLTSGADDGGVEASLPNGDGDASEPATSCAGVTCSTPDAKKCLDAKTLRKFASSGTCQSGACTYAHTDVICANGCENSACVGVDPCDSVSCNSPPATACLDATTLKTYSMSATCAGGTCSYTVITTICSSGCSAGACKGACAGVTCTPPIPSCADTNTLRTPTAGTCTGGTCSYTMVDTACANGCSGGVCAPCTGGCSATTVAAGSAFSCALTAVGGVKCWGKNNQGQLGNNSTTGSHVPVDVVGLSTGVTSVSAGGSYACALTTAGGVKCWGGNFRGTLGNDSTADSLVPVDVTGLATGVSTLSAGYTQVCVRTTSGAVKCWGSFGDALTGSDIPGSLVPATVTGLASGVLSVSVGARHACAVTDAGALKCWGYGNEGRLGNGTTSNSASPVDATGLASGVTSVSAGAAHSCARLDSGDLRCWGQNLDGELGTGGTSTSQTPHGVVDLITAMSSVSAGGLHTCARAAGGGVRCWGSNQHGDLGAGTVVSRSLTPVSVVGLGASAKAVSSGGLHSCAAMAGGGIKCWGSNFSGELGNDSTTDSNTPVSVVGFP